ncbi:NTP pyrophosphohydrolase [Kitasatospora sp. NA04385]|uniref:NTP pyrophosphohydrolase n=1 Tax=Kitasatospora sp. NA04385 TaxID=2742135 RepID=UPI00158FA078|nr:NTP pyrophosphohydrolase [Kitasatospora sp. NA04385]QKW24680.1 NTP pyrophosphohydrolase [Kitasatospora sp. NA04385]
MLVVDGANVVGSVPDGWWRDRRGAAERLRDALVDVAADGLPGLPGPLTVVLVVEGAARGVEPVPGVRVVSAPGSGDDRIVELVAEESASGAGASSDASPGPGLGSETGPGSGSAPGRRLLVVTADRELRERVAALGAELLGPRTVRHAPGRTERPR